MKSTFDTLFPLMDTIKTQMETVFDEQILDTLAKEKKFIQRCTNQVEAKDFVTLMSVEMLEDPMISLDGMCDILSQLNTNTHLSPQALQQRINTQQAVEFLKTVFADTLSQTLNPVLEQTPASLLVSFDRIFIQDSTIIQLREQLAEAFRGCGGSASASSLKLSLIYDHHYHQLHHLLLTEGKTAETTLGEELFFYLKAGDLVLRDLGYFTIDALRKIETADAYFLSRFPKGTGVYLTSKKDAEPINLPAYLDKHHAGQNVVDLDVYLGELKFPCRLIAYRAPDFIVNQRRRKAHQAAHKKGRKPTAEYLNWLRFSFYVTNVPRSIWEAYVVGTVYRLRWNIELIFKQWKSLLGIHILKGTSEPRIQCLVYGRLIAIAIITLLYRCFSWYSLHYHQREASAHNCWLLRKGRLVQAIIEHKLALLLEDLFTKAARRLLKQKRKRKTTDELIDQKVAFSVTGARCAPYSNAEVIS
ncbi:MAG: IS4 family transposase [Planctomycetota bacterium]|jgi:hypothetical protein